MQSGDFIVPARSWRNIREVAGAVRESLGLSKQLRVPAVEIIEEVLDQRLDLLSFQLGSFEEMGSAEGLTCPNGTFIMLREDVYHKASEGDPRARFTTIHELGHWVMHTNIPLARSARSQKIAAYKLAEPQANQFAAEFLMPTTFVSRGDNEQDLMTRFGVSFYAARHRLSYLRKEGLI
ncbi:MAG TPA: ImmA/IrrE family metallo-endopeptidase [Bacillales bacterium]|nr:ImmA/IrrE family metallo-endopeptidase [Bacillales bacterium]